MKKINIEPVTKGARMANRIAAAGLFGSSLKEARFWAPIYDPLRHVRNDINDAIKEGIRNEANN